MECNNCGNMAAYAMRFTNEGQSCNACGSFQNKGTPDVYFRAPYLDPNLAHPNRPWEKDGVWVESKQHKARLMAEQNLVERGDHRHGARNYDKSISASERRHLGIRD